MITSIVEIFIYITVVIVAFVLLRFFRAASEMLQPIEGINEYDDGWVDKTVYHLLVRQIYPFEKISEFFKLFRQSLKLKNKKRKDQKRYVACVAYTSSFTFGKPISSTIKEYKRTRRAWVALVVSKFMAIIHQYFILDKKHYGVIYYVEEK